ncbi:2-amino-4-hydroxy-6-hydroxymethyldihydropteridine diphosphokinase [Oceanispirochaeta sp. M1]|uniref:2-amino-4-hydroxy-6- hydroxymethyldihydropteridine diphosphokinase n=1 Tax=unclassified Oceanispirochaeta TaxID=2635722 RepID=UPI0021023BC6|nr:2-amino-4-hydroxy-6-hydroxymethyldihydropteridine diphosphokinase [Oceanispirochaeta sp. M1]
MGTNVGDRIANLLGACRSLNDILDDFSASSVWETRAMIVEDQPNFLNMAVCGDYQGGENSLLEDLQRIEASLGRDRSREIPKGPRTMDLDILFFSDKKIETETLTIPHPGIRLRAFVLYPLLEVYPKDSPAYIQYKEALEQMDDQGVECFIKIMKGKSIFKALEEKRIE